MLKHPRRVARPLKEARRNESYILEGAPQARDDAMSDGAGGLKPLPPLDRIHPRHAAYARGLVSKLGVTPSHEHEDLVQEILFQAHRSRDSPLQPRALLFGITRHVVYRWFAEREAEREKVAAAQGTRETPFAPSAEEQWHQTEAAQAAQAALESLPEMFRDVYLRCHLGEETMPAYAAEIGIPVNTGYTRLHLARERFDAALARELARRKMRREDF